MFLVNLKLFHTTKLKIHYYLSKKWNFTTEISIIKSLESIQYTFQSEAIMNHEDSIMPPSLVKNKMRAN